MKRFEAAQEPIEPSSAAAFRPRFLETLMRLLPRLVAWARGRLPPHARQQADTEDLVQDAALGALCNQKQIESRGEPGLWVYLRNSVLNGIRDETRRSARGEVALTITDSRPDPAPTPDRRLEAREERRLFQAALDRLSGEDQALIIGRVELHLTCEELARVLGSGSPGAIRAASKRALLRLAQEMDRLKVRQETPRISPSGKAISDS